MSRFGDHTVDATTALAISFGGLLLTLLVPDRAGAQHYPLALDSTPRVTGETDLSIGTVVGEPEYSFGSSWTPSREGPVAGVRPGRATDGRVRPAEGTRGGVSDLRDVLHPR